MSFSLIEYVRNIVKPSKKLPKKKDNKMRVVVEGGDYGGWYNHLFDMGVYSVPQDITRIIIDDYSLDLVAIINSEGNLDKKIFNLEQAKSLDLDYSTLLGEVPRPTTLITEDGRIFFDLSLDGPNKQRLNHLLTYLAERYGKKGGFEGTYKQLTARNK